MTTHYPIYLSLNQRDVLVVGGGKIATRKILGLLDTGANLMVVAPKISVEISQLSTVNCYQRPYHKEDVEGKFMVFICTNQPEVNQLVRADCQEGQLVNDCTDKAYSDFYNMAVVETEELLLAISSKGLNPTRAKKIKGLLTEFLTSLPSDE